MESKSKLEVSVEKLQALFSASGHQVPSDTAREFLQSLLPMLNEEDRAIRYAEEPEEYQVKSPPVVVVPVAKEEHEDEVPAVPES